MNIEKTISEQAVSDILTPMLDSQDRIVTEDVAPLFDAATGLDTPPASGTVTTTIEESRSVITAIIRKAWTATLTMLGGASVLSSIAAAYTYLRNRLQGNDTYGIPDRRSEISASSPLAANLALLNDRKISEPNAIDGISLIQQLAGTVAASMTLLVDTTHGWTFRSTALFSIFSAVEEWTLNCKDYIPNSSYGYNHSQGFFKGNNTVRKLNIPEFEGWQADNTALFCYIAANCANIEEIHAPAMWRFNGENSATNTNNISQNPKLWCVEMGDMKDHLGWSVYYFYQCPKLIRLEFKGVQGSINLSNWNPSYVLSDNPTGTDLIEEGSTAQNNLQQFLENFRDYIAERLAKYTGVASGKPLLTLSQTVRNAIEADGIASYIKNDRNWEISPEPNNQ